MSFFILNFYGFLILMVIAAIVLLKYQLDQKDIKQQQIDSRANVITRVQPESSTTNSKQPKKSTSHSVIESATEQKTTSNQNNKQPLSYLEVYYQLKDARTCQPIFKQWYSKGLEADLTQIIYQPYRYYGSPIYPNNEKPPITSGQKDLLEKWHDKCQKLWLEYAEVDGKKEDGQQALNSISQSIEHRLNNTATKTALEIELKNVLKTTLLWQQRYDDLEQALQGEDSLSEPELDHIKNQIKQLEEQQYQLFVNMRNLTHDESDPQASETAINNINQEIVRLSTILKEQKVVNQPLVQQRTDEFNSIDQKLFSYFYTSYGDVFYEALSTVVGFDNLRYIGSGYSKGGAAENQRITPIDMVLEANGLNQNSWHVEPLNTATHLYLCDLGMRCDVDSRLIFNLCLRSYPTYPDSCNSSVQSFYKEDYVSPNQWQDVITFKQSYEDLFSG